MRKLCLVAALSAAGCVSISTLQTASTVPNGKVRMSIAPQFGSFAPPGPNSTTTSAFPLVEAGARWGTSDSTDIGVKAGNTGAQMDAKVMVGNSQTALVSLDGGAGFTRVSNLNSANSSNTILNLFGAALVGLRAGTAEVVFGPKLIFEHAWATSGNTTRDGSLILLAGAFGVAIRADRFIVMPEINLGSVIFNDPCTGSACTGGLAIQAALGFHFDR